jgi:integrase
MGLGSYPDTTLEAARSAASAARGLLDQGLNPLAVKRRTALEERTVGGIPKTVVELFWRWFERAIKPARSDEGAEIGRSFQRDVLPLLGAIPLAEVRRAHIASVLESVLDRGSRRMANRLLTDMRQMFTYGASRDLISRDPTAGMKKRDFGGEEIQRERVLSEAEIKILPEALELAGLSPQFTAGIWLMLATACRVGELSQAAGCDVDFKEKTWRIPAENAKNGQAHLIHLSPFAVDKFNVLKTISVNSAWVLPSRQFHKHVDVKSLTKQVRDRQRDKQLKGRSAATRTLIMTGGEWTPHDLRRTAATMMQNLAVVPHVIERCLNHAEPNKLQKTYQRAEYLVEQASAYKALGDRLSKLTGNTSNVIFFPQMAA